MRRVLIMSGVACGLVLGGCGPAPTRPGAGERPVEAVAPKFAGPATEVLTTPVEGLYSNTWTAALLLGSGTTRQIDVVVEGSGKTVGFTGVLSLNCELGGSQYWKAAGNFGESEKDLDAFAARIVPTEVVTRVRARHCPGAR